jgi:hypothetical protein
LFRARKMIFFLIEVLDELLLFRDKKVIYCSKINITLRVNLTRFIVESTRSTVQLATQRANSTRKVYFYSHAFVSNQQACG